MGSLLATLVGLVWLALCGPAQAADQDHAPGRKLAVVVGVGNFADWSLPNLKTARSDAELVAKWLADPQGGGFKPGNITLLTDKAATRQAITKAMDRLAAIGRPNDLVFVYFSSHGFFTKGAVLGIVCHDSEATGDVGPQGPLVKGETTLTRDDLHRFFYKLKSRRRAAVVDVCYGEAAVRGLKITNPPPDPAKTHKQARGTGKYGDLPDYVTMVLVSSQRGQRSWESSELGASIFTHYLLQGLKLTPGSLRGAFNHARSLTARRSSKEKGMLQLPYLIAVPGYADIVLGGGDPNQGSE